MRCVYLPAASAGGHVRCVYLQQVLLGMCEVCISVASVGLCV